MRLIDADALKDAIQHAIAILENHGVNCVTTHWVTAIVRIAPGIDAKPVVHGRWDLDRPHHYVCSECGISWGDAALKMRFCPHCGAEMSEKYDVIWQDGVKKDFIRKD